MAREVGEPIPAADPNSIRRTPRTQREKMATYAELLGLRDFDRLDDKALDKLIKDHLAGNPGNIAPSA